MLVQAGGLVSSSALNGYHVVFRGGGGGHASFSERFDAGPTLRCARLPHTAIRSCVVNKSRFYCEKELLYRGSLLLLFIIIY